MTNNLNGIPVPVGRRICLPTGARTYCAGQRVTRVQDEVVTHFYYSGSALLFTTVNEYVLQTQNILDPSGTIVASKRFEGQAATGQDPYADDYFFYRYDIRGSVTNIVDGEGSIVKSYDYDEFGVTTSTGDTFFNEVTFTGSVADASGLLYMNARYYNPATARFLSQDTYTGSASTPWTQHLYAYCNNNPVNMVDPTGHSSWLVVILIALVTAATTGCSNQPPEPEPTEKPEPRDHPPREARRSRAGLCNRIFSGIWVIHGRRRQMVEYYGVPYVLRKDRKGFGKEMELFAGFLAAERVERSGETWD